jgi:Flp pilus assembly protein TadD
MLLRKISIVVLALAALAGGFLQAQESADALANAGTEAFRAGFFPQAEQAFRKLREVAPNDLRGVVGLSETLWSENRQAEALQLMASESAKNPGRRDLRVAVANLLVRRESYDAAIEIYNDLLQQDPKSPDVLFKLAETYRRSGDLNAAMAVFQRAMDADPTDANAALQLALLREGTGRRDLAAPLYERVLQIQPDNAVALNNLAFLLAEAGTDLDRALAMAQLARQKVPGSHDIADTVGWIYIKKNLSRDAIAIFQPLVEQEPGNPAFHYHLALALLQTGDRAGALREFSDALQLHPSKDEENKIKEMLMVLAR